MNKIIKYIAINNDYRRYSLGFHSTRLKAMFSFRGVYLNQDELKLYSDIYNNLYMIETVKMPEKHREILVFLIKRDIENGFFN